MLHCKKYEVAPQGFRQRPMRLARRTQVPLRMHVRRQLPLCASRARRRRQMQCVVVVCGRWYPWAAWGIQMLLSAIADDVLCTVVHIVKRVGRDRVRALDNFPAALYVTDADGVITYFNPVCIDFTGRQPTVGRDRWCVTWKLYTDGGD